jgi:cation diffusion facilitator CzcD-associated flavoprotein CzcO
MLRMAVSPVSASSSPASPAGAGGRCAIVGGGLAGFIAFLTLRHGGVEPDVITVFATESDPAGAWRRRAAAIRQTEMRSESDGHCLPRSFPGLALRSARTQGVVPLIASVCNRYRPTVQEFLGHVAELRERSEWDARLVLGHVTKIEAVDGGFALDARGVYQHVLLAPGHPGLAFPDGLEEDPRAVHAYEPHEYADEVAVVGAGMAAATEWLNALAAGARVVSVRRRAPERRPLNVARELFSRRGLRRFHATDPGERVTLLERLLAPSYPPGRAWDEPVERAGREGRCRVAAGLDGETQVICATGFRRGYAHDPLLRRLVADHGLETAGRWIALAPDCSVRELTGGERSLTLAGAPAQWAYPAADTLVGAKYAARAYLRRVRACRTR